MIGTGKIWKRLVEEGAKIGGFEDVRGIPLHRLANVEFLRTFPDIKPPALLICYLGETVTAQGAAWDRLINWSAAIVVSDPTGEGYLQAMELKDATQSGDHKLLDRELEGLDMVVHGGHEVSAVFTSLDFAVYEIAFETRETGSR
jgi:hypothetical protein